MRYHEIMHEIGDWGGSLEFTDYPASASLAPFVKSYQLLTGQHTVTHKQPWYILPDNSAHLIFFLYEKGGELHPSLRIVGPRTSHQLINRARRHLTLITSFRPGALWYFCKSPVAELTDKAFDADIFLKGIKDALLQEMKLAAQGGDVHRLIKLIENLLMQHLNLCTTASTFLKAFGQIQIDPLTKVKDMASQMGISERHLRSLSHRYIGQSPKEFLQISRFTQSLIISNEHREWPAIAFDAGYYDQSHMIAAFQRMCGTSPDRLFDN